MKAQLKNKKTPRMKKINIQNQIEGKTSGIGQMLEELSGESSAK